jgi:uncharacterized repeat protein (TIGR01451 family)
MHTIFRVLHVVIKKYTDILKLQLITLCALMCIVSFVQAAPSLEWQAAVGGPAGSGPTLADQTVTLRVNIDNPGANSFAAATDPITVTVALSNQQYSLTAAESSVLRPMVFGGTSAGTAIGAKALYQSLNGIGTPTNNMFTSTQFDAVGTGIDVAANGALQVFVTPRPLTILGSPTNGRYYFGDITFTFSKPINNPLLHFSAFGGSWSTVVGGPTLGMTSELELDTTVPSGVTLSKVSGTANLNITGNKILNSAANPGGNCTTATGACGSILATGTGITSLKFKVYYRGDGVLSTWETPGNASMTGDEWYFGGVSASSPADMSPVFTGLPTTVRPGGTYTGLHLICTNAGPLDAVNATCVPSASVGSVYSISCTPAQPATILAALAKIDCTFTYTAPGSQGGSDLTDTAVVFTGLTGAANDLLGGTTTGGNNQVTATVSVIDALDDGSFFAPFATGNSGVVSTTASVLANDGLSAALPTATTVTVSANGAGSFPGGGAALTINADGTINIPATAVPGDYQVPYQICSVPATTPATCDTAVAYVRVNPTIKGNVFNDVNALGGTPANTVDGVGTNAASATLTAYLISYNTGQIVASSPIAANGTFVFANNVAANNYYSVVLSNTAGLTTGTALPSLPTGWINTGENNAATAGSDGTVDGKSALFYLYPSANVTNVNFGIAKLPTITSRKITLVNVGGPFTFSSTNTTGAFTPVTTTVVGTAVSAGTVSLTAANVATTLTEPAAPGFALTNIACTGLAAGGTATPTYNANAAGGNVVINAAATPIETNVVCTFTNTKRPTITVTKTASQASFVIGQTGQFYTITINVADGPTTAPINLTDSLPNGITLSSAPNIGGSVIASCPASGGTLAGCSIANPATSPIVITVPVSVAATATTATNSATVSGGGDLACTGVLPACTGTTPNTPVTAQANVVITKTDNKSVTSQAGTNNYVISLTNQGPSPANGVVVTDVVGAGLTCPPANPVVCTVTGVGAVCPTGALTIASLTGAGMTIATLPASGALQFAYTCNVN